MSFSNQWLQVSSDNPLHNSQATPLLALVSLASRVRASQLAKLLYLVSNQVQLQQVSSLLSLAGLLELSRRSISVKLPRMLRVRQASQAKASQVRLVLAATRQSTNLKSMSALVHRLKHRVTRAAKPVFLVNPNRQIQLNSSNQTVCSAHLKHLNKLDNLEVVFSALTELNLNKTNLQVDFLGHHHKPRCLEEDKEGFYKELQLSSNSSNLMVVRWCNNNLWCFQVSKNTRTMCFA